ncbi:MAG: TfoX/Sxy family protein [Novosphingobium sp.]
MAGAGDIRAKRMFGEYGVYCDDIFIGVICNDTLYVKPTPQGDAIADGLDRVPPYQGAKPSIEVPEDRLEDHGWLAGLIQATRDALSTSSR